MCRTASCLKTYGHSSGCQVRGNWTTFEVLLQVDFSCLRVEWTCVCWSKWITQSISRINHFVTAPIQPTDKQIHRYVAYRIRQMTKYTCTHWHTPTSRHTGAQPIYQFADVIGQYWPIADIYWYQHICSPIYVNIKTVFKGCKNAWTHNLKWCNHVLSPAEGGPLFNWKKVKH